MALSIPIILSIFLQFIDNIVANNYMQLDTYVKVLSFYVEHLYAYFIINPFYFQFITY